MLQSAQCDRLFDHVVIVRYISLVDLPVEELGGIMTATGYQESVHHVSKGIEFTPVLYMRKSPR